MITSKAGSTWELWRNDKLPTTASSHNFDTLVSRAVALSGRGPATPLPPEFCAWYFGDDNVMSERACQNRGDGVLILPSRDWCDGCENSD
ncbi:hypothetical protein F0Q45_10255 [Mycobacterium simiae]|uniref:Uncharacterized protein n=1 Tax=Mycobacterium simiae TaxID=1784 RepID=A0A5B1BQK5_MYCSI|nr:hypothetical protein [Mycobacterium simiae]KAA1250312.1 hypothetical protein F0Q45_10255 [Mycobacterium simiae]